MEESTPQQRALIYARVSSEGDRQNVERQLHDLSEYAKSQNLTVERIFQEHISGAKRNSERLQLQEMFTYAEEKGISVILCSEMSRLGRSVYEVQESIKRAIDHNINIYFQKENLSLFNPDGTQSMITPIVITVLSVCSQLERDSIKFRLNSGRRLAIERGVKMGRPQNSVKPESQYKEEYAEVIRLLKKGYSVKSIAQLQHISPTTVMKVKKLYNINIKSNEQ